MSMNAPSPAMIQPLAELENASEFVARHVGIAPGDEPRLLSAIGAASRRALIEAIVPRSTSLVARSVSIMS